MATTNETLQIWLSFWKFLLGTFVIGLVTLGLNHQIQQRNLDAEEKSRQQEYLKQFVGQALDDKLEKRLRFAHYFSSLLEENWNEYYQDLKKEYEDSVISLKEKKKLLAKAEQEENHTDIRRLQGEVDRLRGEIEREQREFDINNGSVDINHLHPEMKKRVKDFLNQVESAGIKVKVFSTYRSIEYQNVLFSEGRTGDEGGSSPHNFGLAIDIALVVDGVETWNYTQNTNEWMKVGELALAANLKWGGYIENSPKYTSIEFPDWRNLD